MPLPPSPRHATLAVRALGRFCGSVLLLALLGACNYTQTITEGPTAYELRRYSEAVPLLRKEYNKERSRVEQGKIAYMLGDSYEALHQPAEALEWFKRAYDYQYGPLALERYAAALMQTERYGDALQAYKELGLEIGSRYQYRRQMQAAQLGQEFDESQGARYAVERARLDLPGPAYGPHLADGRLLVASAKQAPSEDDTYAWTGQGYSDLYLVDPASGASEPLRDRINGEYNEGAAAVSPDGQLLAFTRCAPLAEATGYCQLYLARREGDDWQEPQPLEFQEEGVNYVQPAWSADGALLYFSSDHPDGVGGYDIYATERMPAKEWSKPVRLPRAINTQADEHWPTLRGDTLYFASDGHPGFGGLDLFRTYLVGSDVWANAYNLKPPLNGGGDDFGITFAPQAPRGDAPAGYFSSNRGGSGDYVLSFTELPPPPPPPAPDTVAQDSARELPDPRLLLDIYVVEQVLSDPSNPGSRVLGKKPLESATIQLAEELQAVLSQLGPGHWQLVMQPGKTYRVLAQADGYLSADDAFSTAGMATRPGDDDARFELEIELAKIYAGREIVLDDIYYDYDKADIRPDAKPTLRELARNLQLNPGIRIQLGSHTDCRGSDGYNRALSQRRAESAVAFLIEQGVAADRLQAVGYGEDRPRTECVCARCDETEHQLNRRTTFAVLE